MKKVYRVVVHFDIEDSSPNAAVDSVLAWSSEFTDEDLPEGIVADLTVLEDDVKEVKKNPAGGYMLEQSKLDRIKELLDEAQRLTKDV